MKDRHIKSFSEKLGELSALSDAKVFLNDNKKMSHIWLFDNCPYISYLYTDLKDSRFLYNREQGDFVSDGTDYVKLKILQYKDNVMWFIHYDDHHKSICLLNRSTDGYYIVGNIIKKQES